MGLPEITRNELVAVGTSSLTIAEANPRSSIYIRNSSTGVQVITVLFSQAQLAVANAGFVLKPGEFIVDSTTAGYQCYQGKVQAIGDAVAGQVSIFERN